MLKSPSVALAFGLALLIPGPAPASGDPDKGETVFKKCAACHQVGEGAKHRIGPHLNGVIGRTAGTAEGRLVMNWRTLMPSSYWAARAPPNSAMAVVQAISIGSVIDSASILGSTRRTARHRRGCMSCATRVHSRR